MSVSNNSNIVSSDMIKHVKNILFSEYQVMWRVNLFSNVNST